MFIDDVLWKEAALLLLKYNNAIAEAAADLSATRSEAAAGALRTAIYSPTLARPMLS